MIALADQGLAKLALEIAASSAARVDVGAMLAGVCAALPGALGLAGGGAVFVEQGDQAAGQLFASHPEAAMLGELQRRLGNGPVINAARTGRVLATADITRIGPPALAAAALDVGLPSSAAVPIVADGRLIGTLQLLGSHDYPVTVEHVEAARPVLAALAAKVSDTQAHRQLVDSVATLRARLTEALAAAPIEQAKGMLAERHRTDADAALHKLRERAESTGAPLAEVAAAVVARTDRPSPVPAPRDGHQPAKRPSPYAAATPVARHRREGFA